MRRRPSAPSGNTIPGRGRLKITRGWWTTSSIWWRMKVKKTAPPRRRVSFAVDREEIEVNSDWVEAVMTSPKLPTATPPAGASPELKAPDHPTQATVTSGVTLLEANSVADSIGPQNTATGAESAPGEGCSSVEMGAPVAKQAPVATSAPVVGC